MKHLKKYNELNTWNDYIGTPKSDKVKGDNVFYLPDNIEEELMSCFLSLNDLVGFNRVESGWVSIQHGHESGLNDDDAEYNRFDFTSYSRPSGKGDSANKDYHEAYRLWFNIALKGKELISHDGTNFVKDNDLLLLSDICRELNDVVSKVENICHCDIVTSIDNGGVDVIVYARK